MLKPYTSVSPTDVQPILYLDSYWCHIQHYAIDKIRKLGVEVQHIAVRCKKITGQLPLVLEEIYFVFTVFI